MAFINDQEIRVHDWVLMELGHELDPILGVVASEDGNTIFVKIPNAGQRMFIKRRFGSYTYPTGIIKVPWRSSLLPPAKNIMDYEIRRVIVDAATGTVTPAPRRKSDEDRRPAQQRSRQAPARR